MKRKRFTEEQIVQVLKAGGAGDGPDRGDLPAARDLGVLVLPVAA